MLWFYFGSVLSSVIPYWESLGYNSWVLYLICKRSWDCPLYKSFPLPLESYDSRYVKTETKNHSSVSINVYLLYDNNIKSGAKYMTPNVSLNSCVLCKPEMAKLEVNKL